MSLLLGAYHRLPYRARCFAAGLRGRSLERWRYSAQSPRLIEEALDRESWSAEAWKDWQQDELQRLLHRAATQVPYYRDFWSRRRARGDRRPWTDLARWPVLQKETVRRQPEAFLAEDCDPRKMYPEHTSGSTGSPLELWWSRHTARRWYALVEARLRHWHDLSRRRPWALLGGQLVASARQQEPPFWVWNSPQKQLYLSAYHLAPKTTDAYLRALKSHGVEHLLGYPSGMAALARMALDEGCKGPKLRAVLSNAEPLFEHQRRDIEEVFDCPVRDSYGMAELACAASECRDGSLHLWPEVGILEILRDDSEEVVTGTPGRIIATGLLNQDMPLIRYEVGDRAMAPTEQDPCPCGRKLPRLASLEGRLDDVIVTPEGRRIGRLDPIFKGRFPIREAQITQVSLRRVILAIVAGKGFGEDHKEALRQRLSERLGPGMAVSVKVVDSLPKNRAGKLRAVVSRIQPS